MLTKHTKNKQKVLDSLFETKLVQLKDVEDIVVLQKALLGRASRNVKVGGTLVYSTCTINKMENEEMIKYFLKKHKEFKLLEVHQLLPTNKNDGFYIAKMIREN